MNYPSMWMELNLLEQGQLSYVHSTCPGVQKDGNMNMDNQNI